ncbi:MAG TPA: carbon-nitrogen hydrolase family protein [Dehalococcoidales bacterium]|nr:carbon-nitrogen hydrolase family protein [Dehalococcoidales bacterium]
MADKIKIAAVQMEPKLMKIEENLDGMAEATKQAANNQANLIVFPECSLTGYIFSSRHEALPFAETIPGPSTEKLASICRELGVYVIFGLLEKENDRLFNAAAFLGPEGLIAGYRKNHLPFLGVDRFVDAGDKPFGVHQTPIGNIGLEICYDIAFPESSRVMTLLGADILVLPTNFPHSRGEKLNLLVSARAIENRVHVVSADRVGSERGYSFSGMSKIVDASGDILGLASRDKEEIIYGEVSLDSSRQKHITFIPGEWELDQIKDRRPELYGVITNPGLDRA